MSTKKSKKQKKKKSKKSSSKEEKPSDKTPKKRERSRSRSEHRKKKRKSHSRRSRSPVEKNNSYHRSHSYHRSRSNSRSRKYRSHDEIVEKIDKKKLLEIAKANVNNAASSKVQYTNVNTTVNIATDNSTQQKGQTKSINEFVEYCKKISNDVLSNENEDDDKIFHPFETKEVPFNAKIDGPFKENGVSNEPPKEIHDLFPVSSGCIHRNKENIVDGDQKNEIESTVVSNDVKKETDFEQEHEKTDQ